MLENDLFIPTNNLVYKAIRTAIANINPTDIGALTASHDADVTAHSAIRTKIYNSINNHITDPAAHGNFHTQIEDISSKLQNITLGLHTDGLIYLFINGEPTGTGIALPGGSSSAVIGNIDSNNNIVYDGSNIIGMIADRRWFKIRPQEMTMDEFYNANNRTWQYVCRRLLYKSSW
jgi:hypothetical protein